MVDVAAFDFDGTLTDRGSVFGFLTAVADRSTVLAAALVLGPRLARAAVAGGAAADDAKARLFERVLSGKPLEQVEAIGRRYGAEHLAAHLRADVHERFEWHRSRGDRVVIVSASPELYVRVAAERLGADGVIATRLAVDDHGLLTGRYDGSNCRGEEKLRRLQEWIEKSGAPPRHVWAYGNSRGDLRMLHAADVGVDVSRLGPVGRLRAFPRLDETGPGRPFR